MRYTTTVKRQITLLSCCARYGSITLPRYSLDEGLPPRYTRDAEVRDADQLKRVGVECLCGLTASQVLAECVRRVHAFADVARQGGLGVCGIGSRDSNAAAERRGAKIGEATACVGACQ